jgi:hypothetical protein
MLALPRNSLRWIQVSYHGPPRRFTQIPRNIRLRSIPARGMGRDLCSYDGSWETPLGTWGRMVEDSFSCEMCRLFCQVVTRHSATYMDGRPLSTKTEDVIFHATAKIAMAVTESLRDLGAHSPDKLACIKRIGLEVRIRQDTMFDGVLVKEYEPLALYNDVLRFVMCWMDSICLQQRRFNHQGAKNRRNRWSFGGEEPL